MHEQWTELLHTSVQAVSLVAALLLLLGTAITTAKWISESMSGDRTTAFKRYRHGLGRTILVGLEVLLAATILKTIWVSGTMEELLVLFTMVAIRTFIGWTTSLEMNGRWPWQRR